MATFTSWSGNISFPIVDFIYPVDIRGFREAVLEAERRYISIHAIGSRWAFSAPGYCDGFVVCTDQIAGFPSFLQQAVIPSSTETTLHVAVESGIKVRNLYHALWGDPERPRPDGRDGVPDGLLRGRRWTLESLGGAGGQSIAGVINTNTHGGDVQRPPISDSVLAMLIVGSHGNIWLVQGTTPSVDARRLESSLREMIPEEFSFENKADDEALNAAVVSVGRFGLVYAYVLKVHDESNTHVVENRFHSTWLAIRGNLVNMVERDRIKDAFLQIVINPVPQANDRKCYITRHLTIEDHLLSSAATEFGLSADIQSIPVMDERARDPLQGYIGQIFCAQELTPFLNSIASTLDALGALLAIQIPPPIGLIAASIVWRASGTIRRISPTFLLGDVIAELLNLSTSYGFPQLIEFVNGAILDRSQTDRRADGNPYLVHGRRAEIADFFDYNNNCYKGDSVEIFFPVDEALAGKVEQVIDVFNQARKGGTPIGAYISLRFMAPSRALISIAAFAPTCSIEVSMLRGIEGNPNALTALQRVATRNRGLVHWGQQNDLDSGQVENLYGERLRRWRQRLADAEGDSFAFSTPFSRSHGLEPDFPVNWSGWIETGMITGSSPSVASAGSGMPLEVFVLNTDHVINSQRRTIDGAGSGWRQVRHESFSGNATPVAIRGVSGRIEIFCRGTDNRLKHSWEEGHPGGTFAVWDTKGGNSGPEIDFNPIVTAHADRRFEVFAQGARSQHSRLLHCWAHFVDTGWGDFLVNGNEPIGSPPGACLRQHLEGHHITDQLLVVATNATGTAVMWKAQTGLGGRNGWTEWNQLSTSMNISGGGSPVAITLQGRVHALAIQMGNVVESIEEDRTVAVSWLPWQPLPLLSATERLAPDSRLVNVGNWLFGLTLRGEAMAIEFIPATGWGAWINLGGRFTGDLSAGILEDGRLEIFGRRSGNSHLMARRQTGIALW